MLDKAVRDHIDQLVPVSRYKPFPAYGDRTAWSAVCGEVRGYYEGVAHGLSQAPLDPLRATRYMDFQRDGNRRRYEEVFFSRRSNLVALMLAECLEGEGKYIDDIIDYVWAICEETTWVVPAHNQQGDGVARELCDIELPAYIDLFAAETGSALTWVYYFLADEIAKRAPLVKRRIEIEIKRRILDPYLTYENFWWKGFTARKVNNWNPWINSNVLPAFLILETDEKRRREGVLISAKSTQTFIDVYEPDGGCDEGPGYFSVAGASLLDYLEIIGAATDCAVDLYGEPLIQNMARYIYRVHAARDRFVNFADAPARSNVCANLLERTGERIGDEMLVGFSRYLLANRLSDLPYAGTIKFDGFRVHRTIMGALTYRPVRPEDAPYRAPKGHMFDGIQVMTARKAADSAEGIFIAAKGGNNAESHNHNDVGSFLLFRDGKPVIVDAGVETYTKKTFSERRYEIWTMRSDYHSLPTVNGFTQRPGGDAKANDVRHSDDGNTVSFSLDIVAAYPEEAGILEYRRALTYDRAAQTVMLEDAYVLSRADTPLTMHLIGYHEPDISRPGLIDLNGLMLDYDADAFAPCVERIELADPKIRGDWGTDALFRIRLTAKTCAESGNYSLRFYI